MEGEDEVAKDVKRLFDEREVPYMVPLDPGGVIFSLKDGFTQHDEWPRENDVIGHSPFLPDIIESFPSPFDEGTFEKTMLKRFGGPLPHALQLGAYREVLV